MRITLCGSMTFAERMAKIKTELENFGHEVKVPDLLMKDKTGRPISIREYWGTYNNGKEYEADHSLWDKKKEAIDAHNKKIEWCDAILVVNVTKNNIENYIGGNTFLEMGLAFYLGKKILLLNPVPKLIFREEILGMKPIVLNGVLDTIMQ